MLSFSGCSQEPEEVDKAVRRKADAVGFDLADADQWFVNSPGWSLRPSCTPFVIMEQSPAMAEMYRRDARCMHAQ